MAVEDAPFDEVAALIFAQRVFVVVVIEPVCQFAGAEAETLWTRTQKADHETGAADNK